MIAVVVDEYEDAVDYVRTPGHVEPVFVICKFVHDVPRQVNAIAFLGGTEAVREAALQALTV